MIRFVKYSGLAFIVLYMGALGWLYVNQRDLLYVPAAEKISPIQAGFAKAQALTLDTEDGEKLVAWYVPPEKGRLVLLYFHGNASRLHRLTTRFKQLTAEGEGLLAIGYRGYSGSTGSPSEEGLYLDASAAYRYLIAKGHKPEEIVVVGASLGSGVAVELASRLPIGALVLDSAFSSTADVAADRYPIFPVHWLMEDQFHSDERIDKIKAPLLMAHGTEDDTVPFEFGRKLFDLAPEPKQFVEVPGANHIVLQRPEVMQVFREFLARQRQRLAAKAEQAEVTGSNAGATQP